MPAHPDPALRARCTRFLSGHGPADARLWVERLAGSPDLGLGLDEYGEGPAVARLEAEVAALLGKEAALFFPKGVVAQQAALLAHAGRSGRRIVAVHPKSHLAFDEDDALDRLAGLPMLRLGPDHRPFTAAELAAVAEPLAAVSVELPLRRAAFQAPAWDELAAIAATARARGVPLHLDGARLWEVQPWYGRPLAEIAALADTVYVSFYKGLGGMGGCVLAGPKDVMEAAKVWRGRFGGNFYTAFPYVLTALDGLRRHLPRMAAYHAHAVSLAGAIGGVAGVRVLPAPPQGNAFQVHLPAAMPALQAAAAALAESRGWWLFNRFGETAFPDTAFGEVSVGEASLGWSPAEAAAALAELLERARTL
ncbi:MAG TPA: beta-eliminating lyase-related protein [Alphaproteobacteria bacterium]|nr:beta-eliminating lyase-related protein [Alphaproteobacteria bacterium]